MQVALSEKRPLLVALSEKRPLWFRKRHFEIKSAII
jgi:hypothetical protein